MQEEKLVGNHILSYSYRINDMLLIICNDNSDERDLLFAKIGRTVHWVVEKMKHELKVDSIISQNKHTRLEKLRQVSIGSWKYPGQKH